MTDLNIFEAQESQVRSYCRSWPTVFDRAQGSYIYAEDDLRASQRGSQAVARTDLRAGRA